MRFRFEQMWQDSHAFRFFTVILTAVILIGIWIGPPVYFDTKGWGEAWIAGWVMAPAFIVFGGIILAAIWGATE